MKLTRLRLHGFKSFADRTDVDFHDGITAIVGPNGCGKSNISDAIRWVLGEQRPTAIRGAKMEEAIFQGSVNRRPVSRGAVTMVVSNEDGALPVPFEEVEIGRTVYRDGGSEYSLNRSSCRLRDVHDLCRDTGLGANAYSVIENRMIDAILSDRAEERRALFEEAAGIGKYKDRRKAATRRLERAELDLERLEDVIAEVESKVRSLARQKGKAERYHEYRARRLAVEVAVVRHQLELLQSRLSDIDSSLAGKSGQGEGIRAELQTLETEYESLRIRQVDAERARGEAAAALDAVRSELNRWERDLAVADERASAATRRLEQIGFDRSSTTEAIATTGAQLDEIGERDRALQESLVTIRAEVEAHADTAGAVRERLGRARERLEAVESRERDLARRGALLDGDAEAATAQADELERRLVRLQEELERASDALSDIKSQGDLFNSRQQELGEAEDAAKAGSADAMEEVERARKALDAARAEELAAVDRASSVETRLRALRRVQEGREGVEPVIREALAQTGFAVLGTLSDFVEAPSDVAESLESFLGPLARALVVPDRKSAEAARRWFREGWTGGGGLILMPADSAPAPKGSLPEGVKALGPGTAWVEALLGGVAVVEDEALTEPFAGDRVRISRTGGSVDPRGVIRVGDPSGSAGVLARREEIRALETEDVRAREVADGARATREELQKALKVAEEALERARATVRQSEDEARSANAEAAARSDRESRAREHQLELTRQLEGTRAARDRTRERSREAQEDRASVAEEETELVVERDAARAAMAEVQEEWETARAEESRLRVELTRAEGEASRLAERLAEVQARHSRARERQSALQVEEAELTEQLAHARSVSVAGAEATQDLFRRRDESQAELDRRHAALSEVAEAVATAERRVREARSAEREATDRRHRLELEKQELLGRVGRIEERLEGEWGRPLEVLLSEAEPVEGEPEVLEEELRDLVIRMERLGPVNMLAVEEHAEESQRLSFLKEQRDDLVGARDDLRKAIREINQTATGLFDETFQAIRTHFREVHFKLFQGGEADLWLADPDDLLESPIEIHACPTGKKTQRIDLLSGGERALTALSLLFAIYLVKPSPFCVLDEVDGPLDENNIGRFIRLLNEFKDRTQFVVITHNPRTIESADWIYGVTMEEPGVSTVVGVRLAEALEAAGVSA
jgi:chromosome segregation protein